MTKSTSKKAICMSCGEAYTIRKGHVCRRIVEHGTNTSEPQKAKSNKLAWGRKGRQ